MLSHRDRVLTALDHREPDRVPVMYLGQIIEIGSTCDIFANPIHPYTRVLIESVPVPDPTFVRKPIALVGEIPSATAPPTGCRFHTRCLLRKDMCTKVEPHLVKVYGERTVACPVVIENCSGVYLSVESNKTKGDLYGC